MRSKQEIHDKIEQLRRKAAKRPYGVQQDDIDKINLLGWVLEEEQR